MIDDMPRPPPPYLHRECSRHGRIMWYVQVGRGAPKIRIRAEYGTPEFMTQYHAAAAGAPERTSAQSLRWLVERYRDSGAWLALSSATRRQREGILRHAIEAAGNHPFEDIDRSDIRKGIEARKDRPAAARHFLDTMRGLFQWALDADLVKTDPTHEIRRPKQSTSNKQMRINDVAKPGASAQIAAACRHSFAVYRELLEGDVPRELARSVLPVATYSRMFATVNLLNLFKFLTLRDHEHAQHEIRVYAEAMRELAREIAPVAIAAWEVHRG